jgi:hypothetical protein
MIEFLCPNEHKIRCPDEKAGRQAKCPKCGVSFRIPKLEELSLGASSITNGAAGDDDAIEVPIVESPGGSGLRPASNHEPEERQIEFLCPNGHHLHGPATLQGRAGECPECGSRFRIPIIDEPEESPETLMEPQLAADAEMSLDDEISLSSGVRTAHAPAAGTEPLEFFQLLDSPGAGASGLRGTVPSAIMGVPAGEGATGMHPLAELFVELWAARDESSRVEVHLESGSVIVPDGYLKPHSMYDYAALVTKDPDGRLTVTIVPWKSIARVILRALKEVPGEVVR